MIMADTPSTSSAATSDAASSSRRYCSEHDRTEPLWGTADTVDVWLCLEYRPVWKARALTDNGLHVATRRWLDETVAAFEARGLKARCQFVRQPGSERAETRLLVTTAGRTRQFSGVGYGFLEGLDLAAELDPARGRQGGTIEPDGPLYLVCTNGQRDLCCARFGLPVYAALRERVGDRVWQVTHLGGHRFAPNVLTLPDGCLYGRVSEASVDDFVARVEAGDVDFPHLRGRTCYSPAVQAAEAALARQGLRLLHVSDADGATTVSFADAHERRSVTLVRSATPRRVLKSCGDEVPEEVHPFVLA
jgi:hypothetical protein